MNRCRLAVVFALLVITGLSAHATESWPQWGGPDRDFTVEGRALSKGWGEDFWVQVTERDGSCFKGVVDNPLVETRLHELRPGESLASAPVVRASC